MMHIVQVLSDSIINDAGKYLLNYLSCFDRAMFQVTVILPTGSKLSNSVSAFSDVALIESPHITEKPYSKQCISHLKDLFLKIKPNILHTHSCPSACIAGKKANVRVVLATQHRILAPEHGFKSLLYSVLNNFIYDYYIAVSETAALNLADSGVAPHKIKIAGTGVTPVRRLSSEAAFYTRHRFGVKDDEMLFGIFGRLDVDKGHKYYIKAAWQVLKEYPAAKFLIVGDGSLEQELKERIIRYGLEDNVIFTGFVDDITELLNAIDVVVNASESEAMSLSLLEAMSLSKPIIATRVGGNSELITDNEDGILVNYADSTSMALAMLRLICNPDFASVIGDAAGQKMLQHYTAPKAVTRLEDVYKEISKGRPSI